MTASSACPSRERLQHLLAGQSPTADQAELIAHLDDCTSCQQTLDQLAGADPVLLAAANGLQRTAFMEEASLRRVLARLESNANLVTVRSDQPRTDWLRSILKPADALQALG